MGPSISGGKGSPLVPLLFDVQAIARTRSLIDPKHRLNKSELQLPGLFDLFWEGEGCVDLSSTLKP